MRGVFVLGQVAEHRRLPVITNCLELVYQDFARSLQSQRVADPGASGRRPHHPPNNVLPYLETKPQSPFRAYPGSNGSSPLIRITFTELSMA